MNDDNLDALIRQAHPKPRFSANFQREIWARIAIAEEQSTAGIWRSWIQMLMLWVARPAPAVAIVTTMLAIGAVVGSLTGSESRPDDMRNAYLTSVNPLRAAHTAKHE